LAIIVLTAVVVGAVTGVGFSATGAPLPTVIGAPGAAFVGVGQRRDESPHPMTNPIQARAI